MGENIYRKIYFLVCIVFLIAVDQFSKYLIRSMGGFYICNFGLAFGLPVFWTLFFFGALFLFFLVFGFKFKISNFRRYEFIGFLLIFSGALSNIVDRLRFGCVLDFIDLKAWPVFNLADTFITIGAVVVLWGLFKQK